MVRRIRINLNKKFAVVPKSEDAVQISLRFAGETNRHVAAFNRSDSIRVCNHGGTV